MVAFQKRNIFRALTDFLKILMSKEQLKTGTCKNPTAPLYSETKTGEKIFFEQKKT